MTRPRLLDLFCGAGGAAMGYHRAGFDVVGVDIKPQPRYPFEFHLGDAMTWPLEGFDAYHASPPCQDHMRTRMWNQQAHGTAWMLGATRERLRATGKPWAIENVPGAAMRPDVILCGSQFGLGVRRHRWFELSTGDVPLLWPCNHDRAVSTPMGNTHYAGEADDWARDMAIDWMAAAWELNQAIPPAYTEYIGRQLLDVLERAA